MEIDAQALLEADLKNIAEKIRLGKKVTASERNLLRAHASGEPQDAGQLYAGSYVELAELLGVNRATIQIWRKREDCPEPMTDGRHDVMAWRVYMRQNDLAARHSNGSPLNDDELKTRKLLAEVEERELKVAIKKEQYIPVDIVAEQWQSRVGKAVSLLRNKFESELPPILCGLDAAQIQAEARKAIDEVLTMLHGG